MTTGTQLEIAASAEPITAKRFLPTTRPSRWSAEELAKMDAPIDEGNRFLALAHGGRNVFLTGMAGTGKSWLLREFIAHPLAGGPNITRRAPPDAGGRETGGG